MFSTFLGEWIRGACPDDSCFPSETLDTRDCTCDQFSDRAKCNEAMIQGRDCPATKDFEWTPWSEEVCHLNVYNFNFVLYDNNIFYL